MKRILYITLILYAFVGHNFIMNASCTPFANTPGTTAWTIADQIRAIAGGADGSGNDVFIIRQADLPVTLSLPGPTYLVSEDLYMSGTSDAITILNSCVLDFQQHTLVQLPSASTTRNAIRIMSSFVTVQNGTIVLNDGTPVVGATDVVGINSSTHFQGKNMRIVGGLTTTPGVYIGTCIIGRGLRSYIYDCVLSQADFGIRWISGFGIGSLIERIFMYDMSDTGILIQPTNANLFIKDCQAFNCSNIGFHINDARDIFLKNNVSIEATTGFSFTTTNNVFIESCVVQSAGTGFLSTSTVASHYIHNCSAINCGTAYSGFQPSSGYSFLATMAQTSTANWWFSLEG